VNKADLALDPAQSRYQLGLSSIVELNQAQLNQTVSRMLSMGQEVDNGNAG